MQNDQIPAPSTIARSIAQKAVDVLNEAVSLDPSAVNTLMRAQARCNDGLADHETIVVRDQAGVTSVGILGFVNGIVGRITGEVIEAMEDDGSVIGFRIREKIS